ncbi:MAG: endolytic transglycosylase MltG [Candidatus Cloacimonetes bacterium]|nr:endolytic transglycosylase MltG [Candidatus Cloacimonadota bacterium]
MTHLRTTLLIGITLISLVIFTLAYIVFVPSFAEKRIVNIIPGDNAGRIARKLQEENIISSKTIFKLLTKLRVADRNLKPGSYVFGGRTNLWQTVSRLRDGKSETIALTFPEGMSLYKTLMKIDRSGLMPYDSLIAAATDSALVRRLTGFNFPSLEGFLYPDTYRFSITMSADSILAVQTEQFFKRMKSASISPKETPDFYKKLILASIVEKEAGPAGEREIIAGVFLNRLSRGMRLQSCPTVDYILEPKGIKREVLSYKETQIRSPYNTYMISGLPPTPIANPSVESIKAVLQPAHHSYLYFFADRKGNNIFSRSYEEHLQKQRRS